MDAGLGKGGQRDSLRDTFKKCVRAMKKGRDRGRCRRVDDSPLGELIYMKVLLSRGGKKTLFSLVLCIFMSSVHSVQFSHSVVSDSLRSHESRHSRPPCPSPTPGVHSNSHPSSRWCHPAISSSVIPFSSCPQSPPASESFPMSQLLAWGGQSTGVSAIASFLPKKSQGWSPSQWTGWISL